MFDDVPDKIEIINEREAHLKKSSTIHVTKR